MTIQTLSDGELRSLARYSASFGAKAQVELDARAARRAGRVEAGVEQLCATAGPGNPDPAGLARPELKGRWDA